MILLLEISHVVCEGTRAKWFDTVNRFTVLHCYSGISVSVVHLYDVLRLSTVLLVYF